MMDTKPDLPQDHQGTEKSSSPPSLLNRDDEINALAEAVAEAARIQELTIDQQHAIERLLLNPEIDPADILGRSRNLEQDLQRYMATPALQQLSTYARDAYILRHREQRGYTLKPIHDMKFRPAERSDIYLKRLSNFGIPLGFSKIVEFDEDTRQ